jgi:hypothetical protein
MFPSIVTNELSLPAMAPSQQSRTGLEGYTIKYIKADMDDLAAMSELQTILTQGLTGSGEIVILDRDKFTFMDRMFLIVNYAEKNPD